MVTGPPCAGKSTYVDEHRKPGDVVIDLDRIAVALGSDADHVDWSSNAPHRSVARDLRAYLVRNLLAEMSRDAVPFHVWLVETSPRSWQRQGYRRVDATIVDLDPSRETCHERAKAAGRTVATHGEIERWYAEAAHR